MATWPCTPILSHLKLFKHPIDGDDDIYKNVYKQRMAAECINSRAKELGIERPKIRNRQAIANQNTLIYVLINLRALQRVRRKKASRDSSALLER